jgi:CubicO group peptidase (beta-lactamase class C family)
VSIIFIGLFFLNIIDFSCETNSSKTDLDQFTARLDQAIPMHLEENIVPGAAVAIIRGGKIVFKKGYGFADIEKKQPVTATTGFNIGSISKPVAAWGVMKLVEEGKLELDAPVEKYLTRWHLPESEFDKNGVTIRRLLSHTAGLSLHGYPGWGPDDKLPTIEKSLSGATNGPGDVHLIMQPGTEWKYSGGGYTICQLLVEEVNGQKFADYMREQILRPLGMTRSDYTLTQEIMAGSSLAYDVWGELTPNPRFTAQAAAGLHTTVEDLAIFAKSALTGPDGEPPGRGLVSENTIELMMTPAAAADSTYGLGYGIRTLPEGIASKGHGGGNRGWQSYFQIIPESRDGITIVTNGSNGWAVHRQIFCAWTEWITGSWMEEACKKPIGIVMTSMIKNKGIKAAINQYHHIKEQAPEGYSVNMN